MCIRDRSTNDDILVCDPENEYSALIKTLGGEVIHIAAGSDDHINAMDMTQGYGEGKNPVIDKSEFILSSVSYTHLFYAKPNLLQGNTSFVVLDPKGGARRSYMKSVRTSQIDVYKRQPIYTISIRSVIMRFMKCIRLDQQNVCNG